MSWTDNKFTEGKYLTVMSNLGKLYKLEEVDRVKYLGTIITRTPGSSEEIQARLMAGNRCINALNRLLKSKVTSRSLKLRIYKTIIRPIVVFASEVWTLRTIEIQKLEVWERKVLRKIFGGKKINNIWERRTNQELKELYKEPSIIGTIKAQRVRWMGHLMRMPEKRLPKKLLMCSIGGRKRRGRPRNRWRKQVEEDIRKMSITDWKRKAADKKKWREIVNQAMGLLGS